MLTLTVSWDTMTMITLVIGIVFVLIYHFAVVRPLLEQQERNEEDPGSGKSKAGGSDDTPAMSQEAVELEQLKVQCDALQSELHRTEMDRQKLEQDLLVAGTTTVGGVTPRGSLGLFSNNQSVTSFSNNSFAAAWETPRQTPRHILSPRLVTPRLTSPRQRSPRQLAATPTPRLVTPRVLGPNVVLSTPRQIIPTEVGGGCSIPIQRLDLLAQPTTWRDTPRVTGGVPCTSVLPSDESWSKVVTAFQNLHGVEPALDHFSTSSRIRRSSSSDTGGFSSEAGVLRARNGGGKENRQEGQEGGGGVVVIPLVPLGEIACHRGKDDPLHEGCTNGARWWALHGAIANHLKVAEEERKQELQNLSEAVQRLPLLLSVAQGDTGGFTGGEASPFGARQAIDGLLSQQRFRGISPTARVSPTRASPAGDPAIVDVVSSTAFRIEHENISVASCSGSLDGRGGKSHRTTTGRQHPASPMGRKVGSSNGSATPPSVGFQLDRDPPSTATSTPTLRSTLSSAKLLSRNNSKLSHLRQKNTPPSSGIERPSWRNTPLGGSVLPVPSSSRGPSTRSTIHTRIKSNPVSGSPKGVRVDASVTTARTRSPWGGSAVPRLLVRTRSITPEKRTLISGGRAVPQGHTAFRRFQSAGATKKTTSPFRRVASAGPNVIATALAKPHPKVRIPLKVVGGTGVVGSPSPVSLSSPSKKKVFTRKDSAGTVASKLSGVPLPSLSPLPIPQQILVQSDGDDSEDEDGSGITLAQTWSSIHSQRLDSSVASKDLRPKQSRSSMLLKRLNSHGVVDTRSKVKMGSLMAEQQAHTPTDVDQATVEKRVLR